MRKLARRLSTVTAALATITSLLLVQAPSPAAAAPVTLGFSCEGVEVTRCAWVNVDGANNRVRAWGHVQDNTSGRPIVSAYVCLYVNGVRDHCGIVSGGRDSHDVKGELRSCYNGRSYQARVFWWRGVEMPTPPGDHKSGVVYPNIC